MRTFTITDECNSGVRAEHVPADAITDVIRLWFGSCWAEVQPVADALQAKVRAGEYHGDEETYLGIRVEPEH